MSLFRNPVSDLILTKKITIFELKGVVDKNFEAVDNFHGHI